MNRFVAVLAVVALIAVGVQFFVYDANMKRASEQTAALRAQLAEAELKSASQEERLAQLKKELDQTRAVASEVHKLRAEVTQLRNSLQAEKVKAGQTKTTAKAQATPEESASAAPKTPETMGEMAQEIGKLRNKMLGGGGPLTDQEKQWLNSLKPELEKLEHSPKEFAEFQAGLIQSVVGLEDPAKVEQIRGMIEKVYDRAVTQGLDIPSRRDDSTWVDQRHQLDRRGTQAVQNMLTETERAAFDRAFLGIMGVDLGTGVDKTLYPSKFFGAAGPDAGTEKQ